VLRRGLVALGTLALVAGCDARLPDPESPGARLYAARCGGCHRIYGPGSLTAAMWELTVQRMQGELVRRGVPPLTADEQAALLAYLAQHSTGRDQP
jgi:mono/diheme cytochrome c family protein